MKVSIRFDKNDEHFHYRLRLKVKLCSQHEIMLN
jgi:rRNA maturation protein Nop10